MNFIHLRITSAAVALLLCGSVNALTAMEHLTPRQQALVALAACEACGDLSTLSTVVDAGLDAGLTVSEAKEALAQLYAYTGFPRSLNALGALQQVIAEREQQGRPTTAGRDADPLPYDYDALRQGTEVQTRLVGQPFTYDFAPQTDYYLKAHLFGDIFARNNLSFADRELVTVGAIAALPGCEPQLKAHIAGAMNMGVSREQLLQVPAVLRAHALDDAARRAERIIAQCIDNDTTTPAVAANVDFAVWPQGEPNKAYARYFTGQSYLADMGAGLFNVTFEPRCRNNWHIHHHQVQVLICVAGRGWYQQWGHDAIPLTPGTVIEIPEGAKHWHGAAADSWMQHITYHKDVAADASNEWLEPVADELYNKLP